MKSGGNFAKVRGKEKFPEIRGETNRNRGNRGEIRNLWSMTKGCQKFWRMKIGIFYGKRSNRGNFLRSPKFFSEIGGNVKQGGMHHCLRGYGRPCLPCVELQKRYIILFRHIPTSTSTCIDT